jgi:hypothetical protein
LNSLQLCDRSCRASSRKRNECADVVIWRVKYLDLKLFGVTRARPDFDDEDRLFQRASGASA